MPVDTAKVADRRPLRFSSIADIRRDLDALEAGVLAGLLIELTWVVILLVFTRWMYARGLRHYSAFGG